MNKVTLSLLTLSVLFCIAPEASAVDRIRIDSIEPSVVERGGEFVLRGADLLCSSGRAYSSQTRVQMQWSIGRAMHWRYVQLSVILDNEIKAHVPRDVAPGEYTIYVVNHARSGALQCRSYPVTLTVRQPAPPAVAADPFQVMSNPCGRRDPADLAVHLPGIPGSSPPPPACGYPMKRIWVSPDRGAIYRYSSVDINGVTDQDSTMVIAILRPERVSENPARYRYFVVRLMTVRLRYHTATRVQVPSDLEPGTYKVAALYRFVPERSLQDFRENPFRNWGARRPSFVIGSNVIDMEVTLPSRR